MSKKDEIVEEKRYFYNYRNRPPKVQWHSDKPSKVQISPLDAKSPQEILERYGMYKDNSALEQPTPFYADLTEFTDYATSLNNIRDIKEKFNSLDIDIRAKFNHNPQEFCDYVTSKDFDIREVMTKDMYERYMNVMQEEQQKQQYEEYIKSDEYKKDMEERAARQAYEQARYDEWKKQFGGSK